FRYSNKSPMTLAAWRIFFAPGVPVCSCCLLSLFFFLPCVAQQQRAIPDAKQVSFIWVLTQQQKRTGLGFLYDRKKLKNTPLIDIDSARVLVAMEYTHCLDALNLSYEKVGPNIVIVKYWKGPRAGGATGDTTERSHFEQRLDEIVVEP